MIKTEIPKITNDKGLKTMTIKFKEFNCIGAKPPHDHPHIYLNFVQNKAIILHYKEYFPFETIDTTLSL